MRCPRCGNEDPKGFYLGGRGWYCRKCVPFSRILMTDAPKMWEEESTIPDAEYELGFALTPEQEKAAQEILEKTREGKNVLVKAVCGAGKTELVYPVIREGLSAGKKVGFAISRRQVVLQIAGRLAKDFPRLKVIPVCEGFTEDTQGDLIVCTTHQLYRYTGYFDTLILDEPDAFPFKGNPVLQGIAENASKGTMIYLTATPDEWLTEKIQNHKAEEVPLYKRPSGIPLTVPKVNYLPKEGLALALYGYLRTETKAGRYAMVFFPTIRETETFAGIFRRYYRIAVMHSAREDKDAQVRMFQRHEARFLFSTTVMERGVTFSGIDVLVYKADHPVFDYASLVQMTGRVGRDPKNPEGTGIFLCAKKSGEVDKCVSGIMTANRLAFGAENGLTTRKTS
ncbi:MAG: DEAD/DEAH box helicase family protein [Erysipelotrichales bacterium]|nr:DEAD/DEAH box helicase family protein [Erysipelotrichales bacterium]